MLLNGIDENKRKYWDSSTKQAWVEERHALATGVALVLFIFSYFSIFIILFHVCLAISLTF